MDPTKKSRRDTVAVDFDKVIHGYSRGWHDGTVYDAPVPGALDGLAELMRDYAVFIHTTRDEMQTAAWLTGYGFTCITDEQADHPQFWNDQRRLLIANRKLPAIAYLDDRGIRFENWGQALADLRRLYPRKDV